MDGGPQTAGRGIGDGRERQTAGWTMGGGDCRTGFPARQKTAVGRAFWPARDERGHHYRRANSYQGTGDWVFLAPGPLYQDHRQWFDLLSPQKVRWKTCF